MSRERDRKASRRADAEGKGRRLCQSKFHRSKGDLRRQKQKLIEYAKSRGYQDIEVIEDLASGLNENRRGLQKLFKLVTERQIEAVFIPCKDRFTRFGFKYLEAFFSSHGCRIEVMNSEEFGDFKQELVEDLIAIVTNFAGRIYGPTSNKKIEVVKAVKNAVGNR